MEIIYFDTCALNRLTDDLTQPRVLAEAIAVREVLDAVRAGKLRWVTSSAVRLEVSANADADRRAQTLSLLSFANNELVLSKGDRMRASSFGSVGLSGFDALHLACCENAEIDTLLTVDDRFIRRAARIPRHQLHPHISNPVDWVARRGL